FASPDKSLTIRHAKSPALAENLLAQTSMFTNTRNQWDGGGAYGWREHLLITDINRSHLVPKLFQIRNNQPADHAERPINDDH
ncbi:hypothetical protein, partial [Agrobacterium vitis]|uniref:hypothetical protein n=1 Tax=Agrobacterium vitis TaxID=373 RepID=UPI001AEDE972